jgi:PiT family inorganic phosphate transporter
MHDAVLVVILMAVALIFNFTNGFHDTANAIATSVSTRALSPRVAVILSAVMNMIGSFVTLKVAATIASGVAPMTQITLFMILAALIGAIAWNLVTWYYGLPSSSSHALIGGLIGATIAGLGLSAVKWDEVVSKMLIPLVISPILGFILAYVGMLVIFWVFRGARPRAANRGFRLAQIVSSAYVAFSHGTNDAQKTMGIMALVLVSGGYMSSDPAKFYVPVWVIVAASLTMAFGTYAGGWRIIKTVGTRLYKIDPPAGFDAQTVAAALIQGASYFGLPVSTTHVVSGSIMGAGARQSASAVRWGVGLNIILAWIITAPMAALVASIMYFFLHFIGR